MKPFRVWCPVALILTIVSSPAVQAQTPTTAQNAESQSTGQTLQEVLVTATKRTESAQTVPIAINAVGAEQMSNYGMQFLNDVAEAVPGVVFPANNSNINLPAVRGIGATIVGQSDVAFYEDGVAVGAVGTLVQPERIEVLKGPQGTYFGTAAVAGVISIVNPTPKQQFQSSVTALLGNYASKELQGYVSGGVAENLAVGVYWEGLARDSYFTRIPTPRVCVTFVGYTRCEPGDQTQWGARIKAVWTPTEHLTITGSFERQEINQFDTFPSRQLQANAPGFALGAPVIIEPWVVQRNWPDYGFTRQDLSILRVDWDLNYFRVVSLSGYLSNIAEFGNDLDATSSSVVQTFGNIQGGPTHTFSQELQFLSPTGSFVKWVAGFYYLDAPGCPAYRCWTPENVAGVPTAIVVSSNATNKTYAGFANARIPLSFLISGLDLELGARYTRVDRTLQNLTQFLDKTTGATLAPPVWTPSPTTAASNRYTQFTPRVALSYQTGKTLYYASWSKGFNPGQLGTALGVAPVKNEILEAYEIGMKSDLNERLRLNSAIYYYDYSNSQLTVFIVTPEGFNGTEQVNAEGLKSYGAEAELTWVVSPGLRFYEGLAYDHAYYKNIPFFSSFTPGHVGNIPTPIDITGRQAIRAPQLTSNSEISYTHSMGDRGTLDLNLIYLYVRHYPWDPAGLYYNPTNHSLDATFGYTTSDARWRIGLWGHNLLNSYQQNGVLTEPFGTFSNDAPPRTYGVSFTFTPHR
jgi:iron complex outermembrane receptor protein